MTDITESRIPTAFPLVESRAKGMKVLAAVLVGRALRDVIVPVANSPARGLYAGVVCGFVIYLLARPSLTSSRAAAWAVAAAAAVAALISS